MQKKHVNNKSGVSTTIAVIVIVTIVIVAGIVCVYYYLNQPSSESTPSENSPSSSPAIQPTIEPSGQTTQSIVNFTSGLNAKYTIKTYDSAGKITQEKNVTETIAEGTYNGNNCWRIIATSQTPDENVQQYYTLYISKSTLEYLHIKTQTYSGSVVTSENETDDPSQAKIALVLAEAVDPQTFVETETLTVTADTFENTTKAMTTNAEETIYIWIHPNVAGYGLVRMESYSNEKLLRTVELIDYSK